MGDAMQELIGQLARLYLPAGAAPAGLAAHLAGHGTQAVDLARDRQVRAMAIPFDWPRGGDGASQWALLCDVANALQGELGLPAPAVSITGDSGYRLWLSFEGAVPLARAQALLDLLHRAYLPEAVLPVAGLAAPVELPPFLHPATGRWAAFIHPAMGASFAEEAGLEMAPPVAGQVAFLQGLSPIGAAQFDHALAVLRRAHGPAPQAEGRPAAPQANERPAAPAGDPAPAAPIPGAPADGTISATLLLKDATLEDIVRWLHARGIEPTFRHPLPPR